MKQIDISIAGMSCAACVNRVEKVISKDKTVISVSVSLATNRAMIIVNDDTDVESIFEAIRKAGFTPSLDDIIDNSKGRKLFRRFLITLPFSVIVFILSMGSMIIDFNVPYSGYIQFVLSAVVLFYGGYPFYVPAFKKPLSSGMNSLVTLGTFTAFIYSTVLLLLGRSHHELYFESSAIIITFLLLGRSLEDRAKRDVSKEINSLISLSPKKATVIIDGDQVEKNISDIGINDIIILKAGDTVPTDGEIINGHIVIDESLLTGESKPIKKEFSHKIYTGTMVLNGSATYQSLKLGKDTVLAAITKSVLEASMHKASIERLADKISSIFTPVVLSIATVTFIFWFISTGSIPVSIIPFVSILVIACPCALGLAIPTAIIATVGRAAKEGVLIRNGEILERARDINVVVFDKTGTLTDGKFEVRSFDIYNSFDEEKVRSLLQLVESKSEHFIARSIVSYLEVGSSLDENNNIDVENNRDNRIVGEKSVVLDKNRLDVEDYENIAGQGVKAIVIGEEILIGNELLLLNNNIDISELDASDSETDDTTVYIAIGNKLAGRMLLGDRLRDNAVELINGLKALSIEPVILSGDNHNSVKKVADILGVERFYNSVSPHDKFTIISEFQEEGRKVAMVGDGINDSIALSKADIGLSLGSATDIAINSSDIMIIRNELIKILFTVRVAKRSAVIIRENLFLAFIYNVIAIPVAAGVLYPITGMMLNPAIAGIVMAASSITVISNSLRLKLFK